MYIYIFVFLWVLFSTTTCTNAVSVTYTAITTFDGLYCITSTTNDVAAVLVLLLLYMLPIY